MQKLKKRLASKVSRFFIGCDTITALPYAFFLIFYWQRLINVRIFTFAPIFKKSEN